MFRSFKTCWSFGNSVEAINVRNKFPGLTRHSTLFIQTAYNAIYIFKKNWPDGIDFRPQNSTHN